MDAKLLELALNNLLDQYEKLKGEVAILHDEIRELKKSPLVPHLESKPIEDELLDLKQVQELLGICYNSLKKLINAGKLKPIRINERRIRFSRFSILNYIQSESTKS
jgi:predicted DNA-binding transcriptional regulator AlpA